MTLAIGTMLTAVHRRQAGGPAAPVFVAPPAISGTGRVGQPLTLGLGTVSGGTATGTLSRGPTVLIAGVTDGQTYLPVAADDGASLVLTVTAVGPGGSATAAASIAVTYPAPVFAVAPSLGGATFTEGDIVTVGLGSTDVPATLVIESFTLDGSDRSAELAGSAWDSTGESAGLLSLVVRATNSGGTTLSAPVTASLVARPVAAVLPVAPTARWLPAQSVVILAGGRVQQASGLAGPDVTAGVGSQGPQALSDLLGRSFWRFEGAEFLDVPTSFVANTRDITVFFVGRMHRVPAINSIFSLGNRGAGTNVYTANATMDVSQASNGAPALRCASKAGTGDAINGKWMIAGSQLQLLGVCSRLDANGGMRMWINEHSAQLTQTSAAVAPAGAEIGRTAQTGATPGMFDLYELVVYNRGLTDAEANGVAAALVQHWGIAPLTDQIVLEGDSITQGTGTVSSGHSSGMVLSDPGRNLIPAGYRVVNMGTSGAQVSNLVTRRDAATGWPVYKLPGRNLMAFEIGRNDMASLTETQHYANVVAYVNTPSTGVLQRGWEVRLLANIATGASIQTRITAFRALVRAPQFATDTATGSGSAFEGMLGVIATDQITHGGQSVFLDSADAADPTYYQGDSTHPGPLGAVLRVSGGDLPAQGIGSGL